MFTDLAGFTQATQANEPGALQLLQEQEKLVQPIVQSHHGRKVKSMGDGLLIEFPNALDAVECAVELQRSVHNFNSEAPNQPLRLRVGIHLGDVEPLGADILGDAVNIASRVEPLADPGGVCLSEPVYVQVHNKVPFPIEPLGPRKLRGVQEPIGIFRIVLPWSSDAFGRTEVEPPRLAVLPLVSISPDSGDEYFADGLTEELISVLSQIRGLRVIARTSVSRYKGATKTIGQIGSELGVNSLLEGSVRKAGDQVRISVQLIDAHTEEQRWARTYDRKLENIFAIQAEVAQHTAGALQLELLSSDREAIQERGTSSLAAYELYLRGIREYHRYQSSGDAETDRRAVELFEAAIRADPGFSAAYSYLANHLLQVSEITRPGKNTFPRARELITKALELNPKSSDAHTARGNLALQADLDWVVAEAEFQQAISLNPSSSLAHFWYGQLLGTVQRYGEAERRYRTAIELDPLWLEPRHYLARLLESVGDLEGAISLCEGLEESLRDSVPIRFALAWAYALAGREEDARRTLAALEGTVDPVSRSVRALVLAYLGQPQEAQALIADREAGRITVCLPLPGPAVYYSLWGEKEKALGLLEQDWREGDRGFWSSYQSQWFDPIRSDPRFLEILRAMKLPTTMSRPLLVSRPRPAR